MRDASHQDKLGEIYFEIMDSVEEMIGQPEFLTQLAARYELSHVTYLGVQLPGQSGPLIETTYSADWHKRYLDQNYVAIDPVVKDGFNRIVPMDWGSVSRANPAIRNFFGEAEEFGVGRQGMSIPIFGRSGDMALFSINSHADNDEWQSLLRPLMRDFQLIAYQYHKHVLDRCGKLNPEEIRLTPRQIEILKWAAEGKSEDETAIILSISKKTVNYHMCLAFERLDVVNKTQAVAKSIRLRLIDQGAN